MATATEAKIKHADNVNNLIAFLQKYPNQWHGYIPDDETTAALNEVKKYWSVETNDFAQMRLTIKVKK